jgi:hypothetical protein
MSGNVGVNNKTSASQLNSQSGHVISNTLTVKEELVVSKIRDRRRTGLITVCNDTKFEKDVNVCGKLNLVDAELSGDLSVDGNGTVCGNLLVKGNETVQGISTIESNQTVQGNQIVQGELCVDEKATFKKDAEVQGELCVNEKATFKKDAEVQGNLSVMGDLCLQDGILMDFISQKTLGEPIQVTGQLKLNPETDIAEIYESEIDCETVRIADFEVEEVGKKTLHLDWENDDLLLDYYVYRPGASVPLEKHNNLGAQAGTLLDAGHFYYAGSVSNDGSLNLLNSVNGDVVTTLKLDPPIDVSVTGGPSSDRFGRMAVDPCTGFIYTSSTIDAQFSLIRINPFDGTWVAVGNLTSWNWGLAFDNDGTLYATTFEFGQPSLLLRVNKTNANILQNIGSTGRALAGIAIDPTDGQLYGISHFLDSFSPSDLLTINKTNASVSVVGNVGGAVGNPQDISFTGDGQLYGFAGQFDANALIKIDKSNADATILNSLLDPSWGVGLAWGQPVQTAQEVLPRDGPKCLSYYFDEIGTWKIKIVQNRAAVHNPSALETDFVLSCYTPSGLVVCNDAEVQAGLVVCGELDKDCHRSLVIEDGFEEAPEIACPVPSWYNTKIHRFKIAAPGQIQIELCWDDADANLDMYLYQPGHDPFYPGVAGGFPVDTDAFAYTESSNNPEVLNVEVTKAGLWALRVFYYDGSDPLNYTVKIRLREEAAGLKVKTFLDLSEAVIVPNCHPCVGWWGNKQRQSLITQLIHIEQLPSGQLRGRFYVGTSKNYREMDLWDWAEFSTFSVFDPAFDQIMKLNGEFQITELSPTELVFHITNPKPPFLGWVDDAGGEPFRLSKANPNIAYYSSTNAPVSGYEDRNNSHINTEFHAHKFEKLDCKPNIGSLSKPPLADTSDPCVLFDWLHELIINDIGPQINDNIAPTDFLGSLKLTQLHKDLKAGHIEYDANVDEVWPSFVKTAAPVALGADPFETFDVVKADWYATAFGDFLFFAMDAPDVYPEGVTVKVSGAKLGSAAGVPNDRVNEYYINIFPDPTGIIFGCPGRFGLPILNTGSCKRDLTFVDECVTLTPYSVKVTQPSHGYGGGISESTSDADVLYITGATGFAGIDADVLNSAFIIPWWIDADNYIIQLPPGVLPSGAGTGGGAGVMIHEVVLPGFPGAHFPNSIGDTPHMLWQPTTTIFSDVFVPSHIGTRIILSGFTGAYSVLNNDPSGVTAPPYWKTNWRAMGLGMAAQDQNEVYTTGQIDHSATKYYTHISYDSKDLPVFDSGLHGTPTIKVQIGPVRCDTEYYDFLGACFHLLGKSAYGTHTDLTIFPDYIREDFTTWEETRESLAPIDLNQGAPTFLAGTRAVDRSNIQRVYTQGSQEHTFVNDLPDSAKNDPGPGDITIKISDMTEMISNMRWLFPETIWIKLIHGRWVFVFANQVIQDTNQLIPIHCIVVITLCRLDTMQMVLDLTASLSCLTFQEMHC